ncbi:MAG: hypothetical protein WC637_00215 [Victivallales bacterium]
MIKILGHNVELIYDDKWSHKRNTVGTYCANELTITIDPTYPVTRQEEGLLHEIFEAILFHVNCSETLSHALMSTISEMLYQIIKDNPDIFTMKMPRLDAIVKGK